MPWSLPLTAVFMTLAARGIVVLLPEYRLEADNATPP